MSDEGFLKLIANRFDPDTIIDILGWSSDRLVLVLRKHILEAEDDFREELGAYSEEDNYYED